ncbi:MAG: DUF4258 domain-containing protein [Candidatus Hydrogenedentes bacterium]|nr:DUF4258 domain-containing protein [Candidatus Hydrogenedentota bacterium]
MHEVTLQIVRASAIRKVLFLPHALRQMLRPERMIDRSDVILVIGNGEIIEDYPTDARGHSCLILGHDNENRPLHVVCAPRDDYLAVITAYRPHASDWSLDFRKRRQL